MNTAVVLNEASGAPCSKGTLRSFRQQYKDNLVKTVIPYYLILSKNKCKQIVQGSKIFILVK